MTEVDVVIVSYNSAGCLDRCLTPLFTIPGVTPIVVDNASADGSAEAATAFGARTIARERNGGFAVGCNVGWRAGSAPYVLFLNPDAVIDAGSLERLVAVLDGAPRVGAVAPALREEDGTLLWSQRRFPRLWSSLAQSLFLHRLPGLARLDEQIRDVAAYSRPGEPDWVSGACVLVRRELLESLGGFDERFFLYREDIDLCRRIRAAGHGVRFEPAATAVHEGGASAPRGHVIPILAESKFRYARKHHGRLAALERLGVACHALTHSAVGRGDRSVRAAYLRVFAMALGVAPPRRVPR